MPYCWASVLQTTDPGARSAGMLNTRRALPASVVFFARMRPVGSGREQCGLDGIRAAGQLKQRDVLQQLTACQAPVPARHDD